MVKKKYLLPFVFMSFSCVNAADELSLDKALSLSESYVATNDTVERLELKVHAASILNRMMIDRTLPTVEKEKALGVAHKIEDPILSVRLDIYNQQTDYHFESSLIPELIYRIISYAVRENPVSLFLRINKAINYSLLHDSFGIGFEPYRKFVNDEISGTVIRCYPSLTGLNVENCRNITNRGYGFLKYLHKLGGLNSEKNFPFKYPLYGTTMEDNSARLEIVGELTNLTALNLTQNVLEGIHPITKLTNLKYLSVGRNSIEDQGIIDIVCLTKLIGLQLDFNDLVDGALNNIAIDITPLTALVNLEQLNLRGTWINIGNVKNIATLTKLKRLDLTGHPMMVEEYERLALLTNLENLVLDDTNLDDQNVEHVENLTNLISLDITDHKMTLEGIQRVMNLPKLAWLNFGRTIVDVLSVKQEGIEKFDMESLLEASSSSSSSSNSSSSFSED